MVFELASDLAVKRETIRFSEPKSSNCRYYFLQPALSFCVLDLLCSKIHFDQCLLGHNSEFSTRENLCPTLNNTLPCVSLLSDFIIAG